MVVDAKGMGISNCICDTNGRLPAHVDAVYTPGVFRQFHHLEWEYRARFHDMAPHITSDGARATPVRG